MVEREGNNREDCTPPDCVAMIDLGILGGIHRRKQGMEHPFCIPPTGLAADRV
jgi:hypothetical protein